MSISWSSKPIKSSPISTDEVLILDSEDGNPTTKNKRVTLSSLPGSGETNTSSNSGAGDGWAQIKVGVDLPFKSLITTAPLSTTVNTNDLTLTLNDLVNADISATAAIEFSKLSALTSGNILVGSAANIPTSVTMSGDATIINTGALTIANNAVTLAKFQNIVTASFLGRVTAATGDPEVLTGTQATTLLDVFTDALQGLVPLSGGGTTNFLRADGTFAAPPGGGDMLLGTIQTVTAAKTFDTATFLLNNPANTFAYTLLGSAITVARNVTIPLLLGNDIFVTEAFAQTLTNKTIDGDLNTIIDINETQQNVSVGVSGTVLTSNGVGSPPTYQVSGGGDMVLADVQTVTGAKTFDTATFLLNNPANTFAYTILGSAITVARNVTIPLLLGNDIFVTEAFAQTLTNKTIDGDLNTIIDINETQQNVSVGVSGTVLTSNGVGSPPTYQVSGGGDMLLGTIQTVTAAKTFDTATFLLNNPANTFAYTLLGSAITVARNVTIPLLLGNDIFVTEAFAQTLTNKTLGTGTVFSVIPTINDGIKFTFNPDGTNAGINMGSHTADPSAIVNGDFYYNSTNNKNRIVENSVWVDMISVTTITLAADATEESITGTTLTQVKDMSFIKDVIDFALLTIEIDLKTDNVTNPAICRVRHDGLGTDDIVLQTSSLTFVVLSGTIDTSAFSTGRHTIEFYLEDGAAETATLRETWVFGKE